MTTDRANTLIASITAALYDIDASGRAPASAIYLALRMDITEYRTIASVMSELGLVTVRPETIGLTVKGRALGKKCSEILAEAKATAGL